MAFPECSSSLEKNEQLKNLNEVLMSECFMPVIRKDVRKVIVKFMEKYQLEHEVRFRNNIGSVVEEIHSLDDHTRYATDFKRFLFRVIFSLTTNKRLSVFLEIRRPWPLLLADERVQLERLRRDMHVDCSVLPRIRAVWPKDRQPPFPRLIASTRLEVFLFADSSASDSQTRSALSLDLAEAKTVMKSLACFHASSIPIVRAPDVLDRWNSPYSNSFHMVDIAFSYAEDVRLLGAKLRLFKEHVYPQVEREVQNAFEKFEHNLMKVYYHSNRGGLNVFVHGDLSFKKILFDETGQCQFFDFRRGRPASPALDVVYFLMSSVKIEVVETEWDSLLSCYLDEFNKVEVRLDVCGRYSRKNFHADILAQKSYMVYYLLKIASSWTERLEDSDFLCNMTFEEVLKSEKFIRAVKHWVKLLRLE